MMPTKNTFHQIVIPDKDLHDNKPRQLNVVHFSDDGGQSNYVFWLFGISISQLCCASSRQSLLCIITFFSTSILYCYLCLKRQMVIPEIIFSLIVMHSR